MTEGYAAVRKRDHAYAKARALRREPSLPEGLLWRDLRGKRSGFKFRQQHPVGPFVLDFYCAQARLGIEIVRIAAGDVLNDPQLVAETIAAACRTRCA